MDDAERIARVLCRMSGLDPDIIIIQANDVWHTRLNQVGAVLFVSDATPRTPYPAWRFFLPDAEAVVEELRERPLGSQDEEPIFDPGEDDTMADKIEDRVGGWKWHEDNGLR